MAGTYTKLIFHVVFSTKNRLPLISRQSQEDLCRFIGGILRDEQGFLTEIGGTNDHIHMLIQLRPTHSLSDILKVVKSKSSKWINEQKSKMRKFGWQEGYAAFTVSESQVSRVIDYLRSQQEHHAKRDFKDEFVALLKKHGIEYKEEYLW